MQKQENQKAIVILISMITPTMDLRKEGQNQQNLGIKQEPEARKENRGEKPGQPQQQKKTGQRPWPR